MARPRTAMRNVKEALRLSHEAGLSERQVAGSLRVAASTVHRYLERAGQAGLSWPLPEGMDDAALERALFPPQPPSTVERSAPDFAWVHRELRRKGVTLQLLWMEYKHAHPDGYQYSRFCELYRDWAGRVDLVMRQTHRVGDKLLCGVPHNSFYAEPGTMRHRRPRAGSVEVGRGMGSAYSQAFEELQEPVGWLVTVGRGFGWSGCGQCFLLEAEVGVHVDAVGGADVFVPEPEGDGRSVDAVSA